MKQRKQYTKEFKQGAARLVTEQGRTISDAATSLSIPAWSLSRWVKATKAGGQDALRGNGNRTVQEQEIFDSRQRIKRLKEEKEILKKRRPTLPLTSGEVRLYL
jgi:transposase